MVTDVPVPVLSTDPGKRVSVHVPEEGRPLIPTEPVGVSHVGCVGVPGTGSEGVVGWAFIVASDDGDEVQPVPVDTLKVYFPGERPVRVVDAPVPVDEDPPGLTVTVQVPGVGSPVNSMFPVDVEHVGWVILPITGAEGDPGGSFITAFAEAGEVHPCAVTVNVYVPGDRLVTLAVVPDPFCVAFPGEILIVQLPDGSPLKAMLPVEVWHVGWVIFPMTGAAGPPVGSLTTAFSEAAEVQPAAVTVKVYVPGARPDTVVVVPDPLRVAPPGDIVRVQSPVGKPLSATVPVAVWQVGWVIFPITGAEGGSGTALITTSADCTDTQPR